MSPSEFLIESRYICADSPVWKPEGEQLGQPVYLQLPRVIVTLLQAGFVIQRCSQSLHSQAISWCPETATSSGVISFFSQSHVASNSGELLVMLFSSDTLLPAQYGHPVFMEPVRLGHAGSRKRRSVERRLGEQLRTQALP